MTDTTRYQRDPRTGRFAARRPVATVDAESRFDPMADSIEDISNVSGAPSPNTIEHPRHAPDADTLAGYGPSYGDARLRARHPEMVHPDEQSSDPREARNAILRSAARDSGPMDPSYGLVSGFGAETPGTHRTQAGEDSGE